ncbi:MAG TPA: FxsA family protein [Solirubrobacteraceae bacterium]|jgi:UPF0716 protein FxsA
MVLLLLLVTLIGVPLLELYVVIAVGHAIGVLPTVALLIADALLGAALMRSQGRAVWLSARRALAAGRAPGREILDGALVIAGGALLIAPGFITDVLGALLLLEPSRGLARRLVVRRFTRRLPRAEWVRFGARYRDGDPPADYDAESSAVDVDRQLDR